MHTASESPPPTRNASKDERAGFGRMPTESPDSPFTSEDIAYLAGCPEGELRAIQRGVGECHVRRERDRRPISVNSAQGAGAVINLGTYTDPRIEH